MGEQSKIEWTDATWNPWVGCTKVSPACTNCYMFRDMRRYGRDPEVVAQTKGDSWGLPIKRWQRGERAGEYKIPDGKLVFTCSWSDWFHEAADRWRDQAWDIIRQRPGVTFQIVTKRTERAAKFLPSDWGDGWPNVWLLVTVENRYWADIRLRELRAIPAAVRGLSIEPLLEDLGSLDLSGIDWVIVGGESGQHARPMHVDWARSLRDQCQDASVPHFFKQWGEWLPISQMADGQADSYARIGEPSPKHPEGQTTYSVPTHHFRYDPETGVQGHSMFRVGKKAAGRLLDGCEWSEFPNLQPAATAKERA